MELVRFVRARDWAALLGYALFTGMLAVGYYYNLTFVQFGLLDLGMRLVGLSRAAVAANMSLLALGTCLVALGCGYWMKRRGWGRQFRTKLRLAFGVVLAQAALTAVAPAVRSESQFTAWILVASLALGVGVPATFSLAVDLAPRRDRGIVAAAITGIAYFMAAVFSTAWRVEQFAAQLLPWMIAGGLGLGVFAFGNFSFIDRLAGQHQQPGFWRGRFVRVDPTGRPRVRRRLVGLILLMFGIYFVDSLGFIRIAETPSFFQSTWQSPDLGVRVFIGLTHVVAALVAGVLYSALGERSLFLWIFGIFALVHFMYVFGLRLGPPAQTTLSNAMLYAIAVSLYTVVNFAIWADVSTPDTISLNSALGVALSAWTATFLSTAVALRWQLAEMPLEQHLNLVNALALLFFVFVLILALLPSGNRGKAGTPEKGTP